MSTSSDSNNKLSALEQEKRRLQQQLAQVEAEAEAEKSRAEAKVKQREQEALQRENARRALLQQEAARVAAERVRVEQERSDSHSNDASVLGAAMPVISGPVLNPPSMATVPPPPSSDAPTVTGPPVHPPREIPVSSLAASETSSTEAAKAKPAKPSSAAAAPASTVQAKAQEMSPDSAPTKSTSAPAIQVAAAPVEVSTAALAFGAPIDAALNGEEAEEEFVDDGFSVRRWLSDAPPWLVSTVLHGVGLMILALMTLAVQDREPQGMIMEASRPTEEESMLEELTEIELEPEEIPEIENLSVAVTEPDPGMINFSDLTAQVNDVASNVGDVELAETTIGEIGALFGKDGQGMSDIGDGLKAATFFGAKSTGNRFVFVVDNSNSMGSGKFETAVNEMVKTVESMSPQQRFYVLFFSDMAYPLFHPNPPYGMVPATPENKKKLKAWLYTVEMCLRTKGRGAVEEALKMNPDAIYILGDGAFTDDTAHLLTTPHNRRTVIHTVGMEVSDRGRKELRSIANANKGTFRDVISVPSAKAMAKANPIKRNNKFGPIWGLELPRKK